jgi:hypothetical protein
MILIELVRDAMEAVFDEAAFVPVSSLAYLSQAPSAKWRGASAEGSTCI